MHKTTILLTLGVIAAFATLAGCTGKIRYPSYYVLNIPTPVAAPTQSTPILGPVAIREFSAPGFLTGGAIAYRQSPEQVAFYSYHRWAEDPRRSVTTAMAQGLQARGMFKSVDVFDGRVTPACMVTGRIDHLEEVDEGNAVSIEVSLSAKLVNFETGDVLWQGTSSQVGRVDQRSVPGVVAEMSRDLSIAVDRLVSSMEKSVSAAPLSLNRSNGGQ